MNIVIEKPIDNDQLQVNVCDFGASCESEICNYLPFKRAIEHCKQIGASTLIVPKGTYYFHSVPEDGAYLLLDHMADFTLNGCGSELLFEHPYPYIRVTNSTHIHICNLVLDWNWSIAPLASVGVVTQVSASGTYFDMTFPAYEQIPDTWSIRIVGPFDPKRYTPGTAGGIEYRPYRNEHLVWSGQAETDDKMQTLVRELSNIILGMEKISANTMRFYAAQEDWTVTHIKPGQCYNLRHYEYDTVAIFLFDSSHITVERVTLYSCPGSGFVGNGEVHHVHIKACTITVRPGTNRPISTSVDCFHIANSRGYFIIEDCDFGYAGDDCINIHDNTSMGVQKLDDYSLLALRVRKGSLLFAQGDRIELRNSDLSPLPYEGQVLEVSYDETQYTCKLTFKEKLPEQLEEDTVLFNKRFATEHFIIRRNRFTNNRARGVLIHGSHGIVEDNIFEHIQGAAIQIETGCELRWSEGTGVTDLVIRNNMFRDCDLNAWQMAIIYMGVYLPKGRTAYPIFNSIRIENNTFVNCPRLAMFLSSCRDVRVTGNAIINANQIPLELTCYGSSQQEQPIYGEEYHGVIQFMHASDSTISNNTYISTTKGLEKGIACDPATTKRITILDNLGF